MEFIINVKKRKMHIKDKEPCYAIKEYADGYITYKTIKSALRNCGIKVLPCKICFKDEKKYQKELVLIEEHNKNVHKIK